MFLTVVPGSVHGFENSFIESVLDFLVPHILVMLLLLVHHPSIFCTCFMWSMPKAYFHSVAPLVLPLFWNSQLLGSKNFVNLFMFLSPAYPICHFLRNIHTQIPNLHMSSTCWRVRKKSLDDDVVICWCGLWDGSWMLPKWCLINTIFRTKGLTSGKI